jgi:hypothetical protein
MQLVEGWVLSAFLWVQDVIRTHSHKYNSKSNNSTYVDSIAEMKIFDVTKVLDPP